MSGVEGQRRIVELVEHDASWSELAQLEADRFRFLLGPTLLRVHHIGSTAIPGIVAKPIVDLIPVVASLEELDAARSRIEALGYKWWGEYGLPRRRYCTLNDNRSGRRLVHAHFYADGDSEIERHIAFRDYLLAHPDIAREYEQLKLRLAAQFAEDINAYADAKTSWIRGVEVAAVEHHRAQH